MLGILIKTDPLATEGKAGLVKAFQDDATAIFDSRHRLFTSFALEVGGRRAPASGGPEGRLVARQPRGRRRAHLEHGAHVHNNAAGFTLHDRPPALVTELAKTAR